MYWKESEEMSTQTFHFIFRLYHYQNTWSLRAGKVIAEKPGSQKYNNQIALFIPLNIDYIFRSSHTGKF